MCLNRCVLPNWQNIGSTNAVIKATSSIQQEIVGKLCIGQQGLGFGEVISHTRLDTASDKERMKMVTNELRSIGEEKRMTRAVGMISQGAWMK